MSSRPIDETYDIQGLIKTGYGSLKHARYILLRIGELKNAKSWIRSLPITTAEQCNAGHRNEAVQIALTAIGLRALGLELSESFAPEFLDGMAKDSSRSRRLGDVGVNAPEHWDWGKGDTEPHILLLAFAKADRIKALESELIAAAEASGCTLIVSFASTDLDGREPFGFQDGISQPRLDWQGELKPGGAKDRDYRNVMAAGEVLLGHNNEYDFIAQYPEADDLGRNGTYIAYRQLAQNVTGFWQWVCDYAGEDQAIKLAEKLVGRQIDGAPLSDLTPIAGEHGDNAFLFNNDRNGQICPVGSHIRRANPRIGDDPHGRSGFFKDLLSTLGFRGRLMHDAVASARFHRILRRGRAYGETISPVDAMQSDAPIVEAGLHFLCLNANLARQFEFVQSAWIASPTFAGLTGEQDPLLGNRLDFPEGHRSDMFSYWGDDDDPKRLAAIPQFVTVKGGAYFFMPGINGLKQILE